MAPKSPPKTPSPPKTATKKYRQITPPDPISANKIWADVCNKSERMDRKTGPFQLDISKWSGVMIWLRGLNRATEGFVYSGYPCRKTQQFNPRCQSLKGAVTMKEYEEAIRLMEKVDPIKQRQKVPPEKYNLPLTVAQEYGWYSKPLIKTHPLFTYPKGMCEITEYADAYYRSQGRNPFQRKEPIVKAEANKGKGKEGDAKRKTPAKK